MKKNIILIFLLGLFNTINSQENKINVLTTLGVSSPLLDGGVGLTFGVNPHKRLSKNISLEGQLSYNYTKINDSFINGNKGFYNSINALVGSRFYVIPETKKTRLYFNALLGLNYTNEKMDYNPNRIEMVGLGLSAGMFVSIKKINIGITYDTPQNPSFKLGYSF